MKIAKILEYSIILFLGNLSAKNPEGEKTKMKGSKIREFTIAVKTICISPS
jgi:hypothetical protein